MINKLKNYLKERLILESYFSCMAVIFILHRVAPHEAGKLPPNENMKISPEYLTHFINELMQQDYSFISLDRLYEILISGERVSKQVVFTLDDGYKDNFEIAYPIFKNFNIPFTIYVTTSFPNKEALLWWYLLEDFILANDEISLDQNDKYRCHSIEEKTSLFLKIRTKILSLEQCDLPNELKRMFSHHNFDWKAKCDELAMSWDDIVSLSKDPLVTIGGHTKNHYALGKLCKNDIKEEVAGANKLIESKINKNVSHFAYPFGTRNEVGITEFNVIKELGFKTATTTRHGPIYKEHVNHLECLPRIMLTENFDMRSIARIRRKRVITI
ncbi:MAG: polysaccharide deacetylase family protein [Nitrosomonas sp.]|nr:polysaccharide deacetylase family protein [Nitrosomonas sp.]